MDPILFCDENSYRLLQHVARVCRYFSEIIIYVMKKMKTPLKREIVYIMLDISKIHLPRRNAINAFKRNNVYIVNKTNRGISNTVSELNPKLRKNERFVPTATAKPPSVK